MRDSDSEQIKKQITELQEQTEKNRYTFLLAEIQTSINAIEMAHLRFDMGERELACQELAVARSGIQVTERFLSRVSGGHAAEIEPKLAGLKERLSLAEAIIAPEVSLPES